MRRLKYRWVLFSLYNGRGIEKHLETQAAKGWVIDKMGHWLWRYRRIEPQALRFAVTYFPAASFFDPAVSSDQKTYWEMCEAAGWEPKVHFAQLQVFASENRDAASVETDPATQVNNIHSAMKAEFLPSKRSRAFSMTVCAISFLILMNMYRSFGFGTEQVYLYLAIVEGLGALSHILELLAYHLWQKRAQKAAEEELCFLPPPDLRWMKLVFLALHVLALPLLLSYLWRQALIWRMVVGVLGCLAAFSLVEPVAEALRKREYEKEENSFLTACIMVGIILIALYVPF